MDYALALAVYIYRLPVSPITHLFFLLLLPFLFFFFSFSSPGTCNTDV